MNRRAPAFLAPMLGASATRVRLRNVRSGAVLATAVERAFDSASRRRGLLGRDRLADGGALVIAPCNGIHTCFMRFPIDAIFVGRDGRVVSIARALKPWRLALALRAFAVIELAAGAADASGTLPGDLLAFTRNAGS